MIKLDEKPTAFFDVDDTLIFLPANDYERKTRGISVTSSESIVYINGNPQPIKLREEHIVPHTKHIQTLKDHALRGHNVIVWSQGGTDWAETVIKALGLELYVTAIIAKPMWAYDDLEYNEFMPKRRWYEDD